MKVTDIEQWFKDNPKGLREEFTPHGSSRKTTKPIEVCGIINHVDTVKTYINMIKQGLKTAYYLDKVTKYIEEYNKLKTK